MPGDPFPQNSAHGLEYVVRRTPNNLVYKLGWTDHPAPIAERGMREKLAEAIAAFIARRGAKSRAAQDLTGQGKMAIWEQLEFPGSKQTCYLYFHMTTRQSIYLMTEGDDFHIHETRVGRFMFSLQFPAASPPPAIPPPSQLPGAGDGWKTFSPPGGRIAIDMPGVPQRVAQAGGESYLCQKGAVLYALAWSDRPDPIPAAEIHEALDQIVREQARLAKATLQSSRPVTVAGQKGIEAEFSARGQGVMIQRAFIVNQRFYLAIVEDKARPNPTDLARFFNSIQLK
jgi:hypothetical protein